MLRTLKTGHSFTAIDGTVLARTSAGKMTRRKGNREIELSNPNVEISDAEFESNPDLWEKTEEEVQAIRDERMKKEEDWWGRKGADVPPVIKNSLTRKMTKPPENKMVEATPVIKSTDCPECGGPKHARGHKHKDACSLKQRPR
ncbi:MAG: hypothetical protein U9Q07_07245 [Planctomycetota bacterium]|nr:hypothetical protein [Planctomycetota bacterium]